MTLVGYVVTQFDPGDSLEGKYHRLTMADLEPVEWSWYGYKHNDHLPDAHVTTAYRVGERGQQAARERRIDDQDTFKLGLPLGQITTAFALQHGVNWYELSLETNASNIHANKLYDLMHYREDPDVPPEDIVRPTLHRAGEIINGHAVYFDEEQGRNMVRDKRLYKRYDPMGIRTVRKHIIRHSIDN